MKKKTKVKKIKTKDIIKCHLTNEDIDLNDPKTYDYYCWKDYGVSDLHEIAMAKIGFCFLYLYHWHVDLDFGNQANIVDGYFKEYAQERSNHYQDTKENKLWLKKYIYRLLNETENFC